MAESGLIVCVPEAEAMVGNLRERFDSSAKLGVPAHITVLFPFMAPEKITASVVERIRNALYNSQAFAFSLATSARFPATTYLEPEPALPFVAITENLFREFPEFPPFGGQFPTVVPHLTVAHGSPAEAEIAEAELGSSLALNGPIHALCSAVVLMENSSGIWRRMHVFPLARSQTASQLFPRADPQRQAALRCVDILFAPCGLPLRASPSHIANRARHDCPHTDAARALR